MKSLQIEKTKSTPSIAFDPASGILEISGRSIPENSSKFYDPLIKWLDEYIVSSGPSTTMKIYLEYFNTGSSKYLYQILKRLEELHSKKADHLVLIEWYYEDGVDELAEAGEDYRDILGVPFKILVYKE